MALLLNQTEQRRKGEEMVFHHMAVVTHKVEHLGLGTTRAVYHAVYLRTQLVEQHLDYRGVGAGGGEHQLAGSQTGAGHLVLQTALPAVHQLFRHRGVVALGILAGQVFGEHVVAGAGQTVAAHAAVVTALISRLAARRKTYYHVAGTDIGVVYHIAALHAAGHRRVYDDGTDQVAHIGGLAARGVDADAHVAHLLQQLVGAVDDGADYLARHQHLVPAYRARYQYVVYSTHAQQVVGVHHKGILCDAFPHTQVAGLFPIEVGQRRLRAGAVGVHDVAVGGVAA